MSTHSAKRTKLTFALGGLFALLLGVIGWMEFGNTPGNSSINNDAKFIAIQRTGHDDIELALTNEGWMMVEPYALKANTQRITPLLSLGSANFAGYDPAEVDLPATGLDEPGAGILIGEREFLIGGIDADDERRYTLVDDKVSFVPSWVWSLIHGGVTAFADLTVFDVLPSELFLVVDNNARRLGNIDQWQALQADKISPWPNSADPSANANTDGVRWYLRSSSNTDSDNVVAELLRYNDRTLISTKPGFAYAISNARIDALLNP